MFIDECESAHARHSTHGGPRPVDAAVSTSRPVRRLWCDQLVRKLADVSGRTTQARSPKTPPLVQVNMSGRDDLLEMAVLQLGQALAMRRRGDRKSG